MASSFLPLISSSLLLPMAGCHTKPTTALQSARGTRSDSLLVGTEWKFQLDIGLEPGTWMPKRHPGWAESGARLGLGVTVEFADAPSNTAESLVGPLKDTQQLKVTSPPATIVTVDGQQTVEFDTVGGWCIQRPERDIRNAQGNAVKPEGLLRFWLDCKSGAQRQDVEVKPGTRIFFTTGVWDDPVGLKTQKEEHEITLKELEQLVEETKANKAKAKEQNVLECLQTFRQMVGDSQTFDSLASRQSACERALPPLKSPKADDGVIMAPNGSLVIKGNKNWMLGEEFLMLGTFTTAAASKE